MGKSSTSAPAADPQIGKAALMQAQTGQDWLNFASDAYKVDQSRQADLDTLTKQVTQQQLGLATDQAKWAGEDRARYETTFKPIEDDYISKATNYATDAKQGEAAAEARGDVQTAAANARSATLRSSASLGINPASGRFAGIQSTNDMNQTLSEASAANTARQSVRDKGLALQAGVIDMGKGLPAAAGAAAAGSVGASGTALSGNQASNAQNLASSSVMSSGYQGAMSGYGGQASTLNQQYGIQSSNWAKQQEIDAQNAGGIGSLLGSVAGMFKFTSDENAKENKEEIAEGAGLKAVNNMPVTEWDYKPGEGDGGHHIGTMAQDMQRETGKGDGKSIAVQDAIGISMKAIQDLSKKVDTIADAVGLGGDRKNDHDNDNTRKSKVAAWA